MQPYPDNTRRWVITLAALTFAAGTSSAQQNPVSPARATVFYSKVAPANTQAYRTFMKTGDGAKAMRTLLKVNPNLTAITVRSLNFTGYPSQEANFVLALNFSGPVSWPTGWQDAFRLDYGATFQDYLERSYQFATPVGSMMVHLHHSVSATPPQEGEVVVFDRIKFKRTPQEYFALMRDTGFPLAQQRVKDGGLLGWTFSHAQFPSGSSLPYEGTILRRYKDLASATGQANNPGGGAALFAKVFPKRSYIEYIDKLRESSEVIRRDVETIVAVFRR